MSSDGPEAVGRQLCRVGKASRAALLLLGGMYLTQVWLSGVGSQLPRKWLPQPLLYFTQVAALFTDAATAAIDYRAEAWLCHEGRWQELDVLGYFPIDRGHKENRFHRAMHFYRQNRPTMQALEQYLVLGHHAGEVADGVSTRAIGGVRFSSIRHPLPPAGGGAPRWARLPLAQHSGDLIKYWYWTPESRRLARCVEHGETAS